MDPIDAVPRVVLALGLDPDGATGCRSIDWLRASCENEFWLHVEDQRPAVIVLGETLPPDEKHRIVVRAAARFPEHSPLAIVVGLDGGVDSFQDLIDDDRIFYLSRRPLPPEQLDSIVEAAFRRSNARPARGGRVGIEIVRNDAVLDACIRLSHQTDIGDACGLLIESVRTLLHPDWAWYVAYDPETESLRIADVATSIAPSESPAAGLIGYAVRTCEQVRLEDADADPRFDADADAPHGLRNSRFLAQPVLNARGTPSGVVIAARTASAAPFSDEHAQIIEALASSAGPTLDAALLRADFQRLLIKQTRRAPHATDFYREEAFQAYAGSLDDAGDILRVSPPWLRQTHWVLLGLMLVSLGYLILAPVDELATGPAVVRMRTKYAITSPSSGLVRSVDVVAGDVVRTGDPLVRLQEQNEGSASERARLMSWSPANGVVSDLRVRPGQHVNAGDYLASVTDPSAGYELMAFLPGSYAPQVRPGMVIVFKIDGYADSHEVARLSHVGNELMNPQEAMRYAGADRMDVPPVTAPVVIVRAILPAPRFAAGGVSLVYRDGMRAIGEVSVRRESMVMSLLPGLKQLLRASW